MYFNVTEEMLDRKSADIEKTRIAISQMFRRAATDPDCTAGFFVTLKGFMDELSNDCADYVEMQRAHEREGRMSRE